MKKLKTLSPRHALACVIALAPLGAAHAATRIVNPGESIQNVVNAAGPGDTVRVLAGTYNQKVLIDKTSGTAGAPITLLADPGVTITGANLKLTSGVTREGLITLRNVSYIRVEGFEVANFSASSGKTPVGILFEGHGTGIQIVGNHIHDIKNTTTCVGCSEGAHGLAVFGSDTTGVTDLLIQKNEVYKNVLQFSEALVLNGNVDRFEVLDNDVHDNNNIGYDFIGYEDDECKGCGELNRVRNGIVRGNWARNNSSGKNPAYAGSLAAGGFYVDGGHHIIFDRNLSYGNDIGFEFASEHPGYASEDILMTNNFAYNNVQAAVSLGGSEASGTGGSKRIIVNNNSFYKNNTDGVEVQFQYRVVNATFNNNILYSKGAPNDAIYTEGSGSTNSGISWNRNLWWGAQTGATSVPGVKTVSDPRFVAPDSGNLNLQSTSPAIDKGTTDAAITTWTSPLFARYFPSGVIPANGVADYNGNARVQGAAIDFGANEFGTASSTATAPGAPSQLAANSVSSSQINLSWVDNATDETGVRIERSTNASSGFTEVGVAQANATTWQDTGRAPSTTYFYRVRSTNAAGNSAYTAVASATTAAAAVSTTSIVIDGATGDWANIATLSPAGTGGVTALKAYADANYLYVLATGTIGPNYAVYINKDNAATTGFRAGIWSAEGSDYLFENGTLYKYNGSGTDWTWVTSGVAQSGAVVSKTSGALELKIPRANLVGLGSTIRIGVAFSNSSWNVTGNIPATGAQQAQFAF